MPIVALLLFLLIPAMTTPVLGQASNEAEFRRRAWNLRMSERLLTSRVARPDETSMALAALQLREFQKNIEAFESMGRDLSTFLYLAGYDSANRRAIARGAKEIEEVVDGLISYLGGDLDDFDEEPDGGGGLPTLVEQLSRQIPRFWPRLDEVVTTARRNLIDVKLQREILKDFVTVKHLCRLLRDQ